MGGMARRLGAIPVILPLSWRGRGHAGLGAFVVHRLSGIALALFLPAHFWVLGQAIQGPQALDGFLDWSRQPLVKAAEVGLVLLLAVHLTGGIRIMLVEFGHAGAMAKSAIGAAMGLAGATAMLFLLGVFA